MAFLLLGLGSATMARAGAEAATVVRYSQSNGTRLVGSFPYRVLKLALSKSGRAYRLEPSPAGSLTEPRAIELIESGGPVDVEWVGANRKADQRLSPVLVPVDGGLLGYRLLLIDEARQPEFSRVRTLADLKRMTALQGKGWSDVEILRASGLPVVTAYRREHMYAMLPARRADYFPRAVFEAFPEQAQAKAAVPGLAVEQTLVIRYRFPLLFYVSKSNRRLHDDIERGMKAAIADGSYRRLMLQSPEIRAALDRADLRRRRTIELQNPTLSPEVRAIPDRYWYRP